MGSDLLMQSRKTLSCVLIGCGKIAGGFDDDSTAGDLPLTHAGAYCEHGKFDLVACVDPDSEARIAFMKRWNIKNGYSSMQQLRDHITTIDVVSVCSPTAFHFSDVVSALKLNPKVIFCEKPLASSVKDAISIIEACAEANVSLLVNYNRRWDSSVHHLKQELDAGYWGTVRSVSGIYTKGVSNNGSHIVDLLQLLLGPIHLVGVGNPVYDGFEDDPSVPLFLRSDSGVPVNISCGFSRDYTLFEVSLITEFGVIGMEDGGMSWRIRRPANSPVFKNYRGLDGTTDRVEGGLRGAMLAAVAEVYRVAHGDPIQTSGGENALSALRICEEAKKLAFK